MSSPLSPMTGTALNSISTPGTAKRFENYEVQAFTATSVQAEAGMDNSSPLANIRSARAAAGGSADQENVSPSKSRHSRVLSGVELSPLKLLSEPLDLARTSSPDGASPPIRSPRKMAPEKRFPVKVSNPVEAPRPAKLVERTVDLENAVRENEGLKKAIEIFEDEQGASDNDEGNVSTDTVHAQQTSADHDDEAGPDDTAISTFSNFSAVPNMSMLTKVSQGRASLAPTGGPSPSRGAARHSPREENSTINLLMDFTDQLRQSQRSPSKRGNLSPSKTTPNMMAAGTPSRQFTNLIDFDIPPMPTPRSVPTITPRELESLKSNFLSEISSLKASLSGKEAEVQSLKTAVGDAEKRVGESLEQLREERATKEHLAVEKEDWEQRGREMEAVLRKVKDEIVLSNKEREQLEQKLEESEKRREAAEMMHQEAESKMAGMRAGKDSDKSSPEKPSNREVEIAVERVARELHGLYKSKHETKVAALKKSYEARWEKKIKELEARIEELSEDNEKLRVGRDATMTKVDPGSAEAEERKAQAVRDSATIKELNADIQRLEAVVSTVQRDNENLRGMLEKERVEKGELVQLAEEMMSMQSFVAQTPHPRQTQQVQQVQQAPQAQKRSPEHSPQRAPQRSPQRPRLQPAPERTQATPRAAAAAPRSLAMADGSGVKTSGISRLGSGLRAPQSGLRAPHERTKSGGGGLPRPGGVPRSGIMSSIEKMGNYRGRAAE